MKSLGNPNRRNLDARRSNHCGKGCNAVTIGPPSFGQSDPDMPCMLQHVPAVEGAGSSHVMACVAVVTKDVGKARLLLASTWRAAATQEGLVAVHDDLVFDEHPVWTFRSRGSLNDMPAKAFEYRYIAMPLAQGQLIIDPCAVKVSEQTLSK